VAGKLHVLEDENKSFMIREALEEEAF